MGNPAFDRRKSGPWEWFVEKVLPGLFLAVSLAVSSSAFVVWRSVDQLSNKAEQHDRQIASMQSEMQSMRTAYVTRVELLETVKRVEQQLEIMMLRAKTEQQQRGR